MFRSAISLTAMAQLPQWALATTLLGTLSAFSNAAMAAPVPGYVAPTTLDTAPEYIDDTRGVYVPPHTQQRMKTDAELQNWQAFQEGSRPFYAQKSPGGSGYQRQLNTVASGVADTGEELDRIARDPGLLAGGMASEDVNLYANDIGGQYMPMSGRQLAMNGQEADLSGPSLATGGKARVMRDPSMLSGQDIGVAQAQPPRTWDGGGMEIAAGRMGGQTVDMQNGVVRLREERISVRRAIQRMMDQIGAGGWTIVWDVSEQNAGLPDMEISVYAEEPFINVLNALLGRLQTRSGQPLRVVRYDQTQRLVITDRSASGTGSTPGVPGSDMAVTEGVLKEAVVSLHYDEVPLVDALENIVNQAGKGQWRLRMYAGTDQVLKPAHIEEPFGIALERILKVFGLRYEVFPGGKLIVVTASDRFGYRGVQ